MAGSCKHGNDCRKTNPVFSAQLAVLLVNSALLENSLHSRIDLNSVSM
jgi:hypothetical protein